MSEISSTGSGDSAYFHSPRRNKKARSTVNPNTQNDSSPGPNYISKLHDDILFHIFTFNSHANMQILFKFDPAGDFPSDNIDMDHHDAGMLNNIRTSKVCSQWRKTILSSTSIWANSIDLDYLYQKADYWRDEVLRRTGKAPLTFVGRIYEDMSNTIPFALSVLRNDLQRMRHVSIITYGNEIEERLHEAFQRPAPLLEHFSYINDTETTSLPLTKRLPLFANHAPRLQFFYCRTFIFQPTGAWLSNTREIQILDIPNLTIQELLQALQQMPLLEKIRLLDILNPILDSCEWKDLPIVGLPRLMEIIILGEVHLVAGVLGHVVTSDRCRTDIAHNHRRDWDQDLPSDISREKLTNGCSAFFRNHPGFGYSHRLHLSISSEGSLALYGDVNDTLIFEYSDFRTSMKSIESDPGIMRCILKALQSARDLGRIETLILVVRDRYREIDPDYIFVPQFLMAMTTVKMLATTTDTLQFLTDVQEHTGSTLFPNLRIMQLQTKNLDVEFLRQFLTQRIGRDVPVKMITFGAECTRRENQRLWFLEEIDGLYVAWGSERHVVQEQEDISDEDDGEDLSVGGERSDEEEQSSVSDSVM